MPAFLAPWFLIASVAAAVPIALHLLHRRRPQPVPFSTVRFLVEAIAKSRRSRHLTNFLTLLMRVLILLLLALAFSQPQVRNVSFIPEGTRTVVILLDTSASMQLREGEGTSFERGRDWVLKLIGSLNEGDRVGVLVPGRADPRLIYPPISDHQAVHRAVQEAEPGFGAVSVADAVLDLVDRIGADGLREGDEVHVFSDFQQTGWDEKAMAAVAERLEELGLVFFLNRLQPAVAANAGVAKAAFHPPAILGGGSFESRVTIEATRDFVGSTTARLLVGGDEQTRLSARLQSGQSTRVSLKGQAAGNDGHVTGTVELDPDGFNLDNVYRFCLPRMAGIPVLLVDGSARGEVGARDTFYLAHAIQPRGQATTVFLPKTVDWPAFQGTDLRDFSIVYICNPPVLGDAASQKLEQFVRTGGVVVLMPGQHHVLEAGLTRLGALADLKVTKEILPQDRPLAVVPAEEGGQMEARLLSIMPPPAALVTRQRLVLRGVSEELEVVFRFSDGAPFAVRTPYGQGSIWVTAVSANRDWSEWPLTPSFVVFQQELIKGSVGGRQEVRTGEVGGSLAVPWPEDALELDFQLRDPEGREKTIHVSRSGIEKPFLVQGFERPGFYRLSRQGREGSLAINIPASETELSYVSPEAALLPMGSLDCFQSDTWHELQQSLVEVRQGRPLWPLLLSVAFLLAISEELFANIKSRATVLPDALRQFVSRGGRRNA